MASKTIQDQGANFAMYRIARDSQSVAVSIPTGDPQVGAIEVMLTRTEAVAALDAPAAFVAELDRLYNAALAKEGFGP